MNLFPNFDMDPAEKPLIQSGPQMNLIISIEDIITTYSYEQKLHSCVQN